MLRCVGIVSNYGSSNELVWRLNSLRAKLRYFLDAFCRKADAQFPGRVPVDASTLGFTRLFSDSIYYPAPDDKESLQDILFTVGRSIFSLRNALIEFVGGNASVYIATSLDLVYRHIARIYAVPHLLPKYLTGK